jgi:aminoglycoside phosphotransferase (APT) family kinase protein
MSAVDTLDEALLASYLEANIKEFKGPLTASKFAGGQSNPTFKIDAASGTYVLRRQPPGKLLKSAHAVDREYLVLAALADTDVPVAKVYHLCEDPEVVGSMFYIMEFCEGNVHWEAALQDISSSQQRAKMYDEMSRVLAAIHSVDLDAVGLADYGRPGNYFQRQYDRWSAQYKASELTPIPEMDAVIEWLGQHIPEDDGRVSLVHGDYRLDNMMFSSDNNRVIAVLDWELSTLGHPFADLAYQCMGMRLPSGNGPGASSGLLGVDAQALGIPSEQEYIASYCQRMGIDKLDNWNFYLAFSFFRLAAIAQGVAKRAADGNASSKAAGGISTMVKPLAVNALAIINEQ